MSEHEHSPEEVNRHIKKYVMVYIALMVLSGATVFTHYLHPSVAIGICMAMAIALTKGSMVASIFMHLSSEKKIIYVILGLMVVLFAVLMSLPVLTYLGRNKGIM